MRTALLAIAPVPVFAIEASALPRDRTSRTDKALAHCKAEWTKRLRARPKQGPGARQSPPHGIRSL